jgi:hypothetical protein
MARNHRNMPESARSGGSGWGGMKEKESEGMKEKESEGKVQLRTTRYPVNKECWIVVVWVHPIIL